MNKELNIVNTEYWLDKTLLVQYDSRHGGTGIGEVTPRLGETVIQAIERFENEKSAWCLQVTAVGAKDNLVGGMPLYPVDPRPELPQRHVRIARYAA